MHASQISAEELGALLAWKATYGRHWKAYLLAAWAGERYRGLRMIDKDAGILRDIRNTRGPVWLLNLRGI